MRATTTKQLVSQGSRHGFYQPTYKATSNIQDSQSIRCVSPKTFSQQLYKNNELTIVEEHSRAKVADSLEKIKNLLSKLVKLGEVVPNTQIAIPKITRVSRMTFSQKLYQR